VRVSLTRDTTAEEVEAFCEALVEVVTGIRRRAGL
jgi:cysteine sulfinate desulfinase/cysteine desulfurase-like protein